MSRDIYTSLSGAVATWTQLEVAANNVANTATTAFKADRVPFRVTGPDSSPLGTIYAVADTTVADFTDGDLMVDNNPFHLALQGKGFFTVTDGTRVLLTRDGSFQMDEERRMVNKQGMALMGEGGPITIPPNQVPKITLDGRVYGEDSRELNRVLLVDANNVARVGGNLWIANEPVVPATALVNQGALERSNVDAMRAMVELVEVSRYFEAYQKAMTTSDELDGRINRLGARS
jgi:flagellar basal-body rod protein FlgF